MRAPFPILLAVLLSSCAASDLPVGSWSPPVVDADVATDSLYLEAESGLLSGGFTVAQDARASGGAYLSPPAVTADDAPGDARARYSFHITEAGNYFIWGRMHSPGATRNRFWFQLDGGSWTKWRISVGDIWFWDAFHQDAHYGMPISFPLEPGTHQLIIANCVAGAGLDRLYISDAGDMPPGNDTPCHPPHSIELDGKCLPSCGSQAGNACGAAACMGKTLISAYDCNVCCTTP
jgi:hypothetical protein